jgi:acetoin utilization deacetylase AcuC-like enzyme
MAIGVYYHDACLLHEIDVGHPERPERLEAVLSLLRSSRYADCVGWHEAPLVSRDDLELVHAGEYLDRLAGTAGRSRSWFDQDTQANAYTWEAAQRAAGAAVAAVDAAFSGQVRSFCAVRPPGHHAERDRAMGFCFLNNVAVAAAHAVARCGAGRVAIVDWDVHHGNGTQHIFEDRADVLYVSLHQSPHYPGTGSSVERGSGEGTGYTLNLALESGAGDEEYIEAFDARVIPTLQQYAPELILVSAGFDAHWRDPLAGMNVSFDGYHAMTQRLLSCAERSAGGRIVHLLEGGYDLSGLEEGMTAVADLLCDAADGKGAARNRDYR